jgi:hypothetical protein
MPSTGRQARKALAGQKKTDVLEDLEIVPEAPRPSKKDVPVSELISGTITDRLSATAAYALSNNMLQTVGKEYAITPVEAYNIIHPTSNIVLHFLPTTTIKTKLPADVADNVEKVIVTFLEYTTRVLSIFVEQQFNRRLASQGIRMVPRESAQPKQTIPSKVNQGPTQSPIMTQEEIAELVGVRGMPIDDDNIDVQVRPGRTGTSLTDLVEDGIITGDLGQVM